MLLLATRIPQTMWAFFLFSIFLLLTIAHWPSRPTLVATGLLAIYLAATACAFRDDRPAWMVAIAVPILVLILTAPLVIVNVWMFLAGHNLYRDSPGTILIVATYAITLTVPAFVLIILFFACRKEIGGIFRPPPGSDPDIQAC